MSALWRRFVAFGFRLLYNELAWLYDPVSWLASLGRWREWQRSLWPFLPARGRVLEVGFGPGHLLADLAAVGYDAFGLDLSAHMLALARRRILRQRLDVALCRGRAEALPFGPDVFDAVLLTFPTPFVYDETWLGHLRRVLKPDGRVLVVEMASFDQRRPTFRFLEGLYRITGQRGPLPNLVQLLDAAGFSARREAIAVDGTTTRLVVARPDVSRPPG